ncbi:Hypothetical protein NTJ_13000 [Nesidiocoris tenuis]|uniref:Uncharacterized protein n=1 Tax=Nesidiocoris tenuis TaxID=355587 RepID=A0ABN7B715_9HEMI|nr:Hypothetical protein NTJ_13000 [Nesidiocoris tenuis]
MCLANSFLGLNKSLWLVGDDFGTGANKKFRPFVKEEESSKTQKISFSSCCLAFLVQMVFRERAVTELQHSRVHKERDAKNCIFMVTYERERSEIVGISNV